MPKCRPALSAYGENGTEWDGETSEPSLIEGGISTVPPQSQGLPITMSRAGIFPGVPILQRLAAQAPGVYQARPLRRNHGLIGLIPA